MGGGHFVRKCGLRFYVSQSTAKLGNWPARILALKNTSVKMISSPEASNVIQEGKVVPGIFMGWYFGPLENFWEFQIFLKCVM